MQLTENGTALAENTAARLIRIENAIFADWSPEARDAYLGYEKRYLDDFKKRVEDM